VPIVRPPERPSIAPVSTPPGSIRPSLRPSAAPARPQQLGRFEILAKIAGGGMASIYLARSKSNPEGVVAVKAMRHDLLDDDNMDRMFMDEANLLSRLVHPNIIRIFEVGVDAGQRFIAMELLLGKTLGAVYAECITRGVRLDPDIVAWAGAKVALALGHAHDIVDDRGKPLSIVHRDVNPSNIFLTFSGEMKLFDFGMAKAESRHAKSDPGIVKGKLPYLAPEQIMQLPLDRRADIFGLGTSMWELLTTRRLFHRHTDVETVKAVHVGPIPEVRSIVPEVPARLAEIVHKALQRNREHRFATAGLMASELEAFVGDRAVHVPARAGAMLDELFPNERKRQLGWLKPAITAAAPKR
jgi:eukaryotic-like serine/threonine-protein kinase